MDLDSWILIFILLSSLIPAVIIFLLKEQWHQLRAVINLLGASIKLLLVVIVVWGIYHNHTYLFRMVLLPGLDLLFHVDSLSILFAVLSSLLWFLTTIYAIGYLTGTPNQVRFFGFFSLCVCATIGIALSGNLITFLIFYELLTLSTYPLVIHRGTEEAIEAGRIYLIYTLTGGAVLTVAIIWLMTLVGPIDFTVGGVLAPFAREHATSLIIIFILLIAGLGVKASLVPLHGWLPIAMVAPTPVSALLHAVAVVKAGAFGIVRIVYDVYGVRLASHLGLMHGLTIVAAITIIYGSICALFQNNLKRRLAYSTVSQVSYITLGISIFGPLASIGGLVHLVNQGMMKITLFFCAGSFAQTLGVRQVSEMDGLGQRMPWTMGAFTISALSMIGIPPLAGFISKWYLGMGALKNNNEAWVIAVLAISSLLNAAYFLPIIYKAWFKERIETAQETAAENRRDTNTFLLAPALVTGLIVLMLGVIASTPFMPLTWANLLAFKEYG